MPSLSALGEFKSFFYDIANEKEDVKARELPFDDLALPTDEAPPFDLNARPSSASDASSSGAVDFDFTALLNSIVGDESPSSIDNILQDTPENDTSSFDDFLNGISSSEAPADDTSFLDSIPPGDSDMSENGEAPDNVDDYSVPGELLSGLSDDIEAAPTEAAPQDAPSDDFGTDDFLSDLRGEETQSEDDDSIDMGGESPVESVGKKSDEQNSDGQDGLPDFNFLTDESSDSEAAAESGINDGLDEAFDLGSEKPQESAGDEPELNDSEAPDFGEEVFDLGGEAFEPQPSPQGEEVFDLGERAPAGGEIGDDFSLDDLLSESPLGDDSIVDSPLPDMDFSGFDSGFDISPPDTDSSGDGGSSGAEDSSFDLGALGSEFASDSISLDDDNETQGETDFGGGFGDSGGAGSLGGDDFSLPALDEIFEKTKVDTTAQSAKKKGLFERRKAKTEELPEPEDSVEEISLTQGEVDKLLKTLTTYPLNLRIACEEIIAEQVILPAQLAKLIRLLVNGAYVKETVALVEEITGKPVVIPKSFEKMTGAAFEDEQGSFAYIFVHNFLPVLRLFAIIAALAASVVYLGYKFVYIPLRAESIYKRGYERIPAGEYQRATELFHDAFLLHRNKKWFYSYAEAFRDERRYMLSENMYDELLRYYLRDKKGVLDYAALETNYLMNYEKANWLLQEFILNFAPNDNEGLLAAGDNFLAWADSDPSRFYDRYEDARFSYARLLELYGWQAPVVERMMKYFIRTDNLKETLYLRVWFDNNKKDRLSAESLAELGGYLLDKQLETPQGVPDPYIESIESVRNMLLQAVREEPTLPEPHYHLARYHHNLGNAYEERLTLENAIRAFDLAQTESVRRRLYRVDTQYRYTNLLIESREFFPAEEELVRGIELYEDFRSRNLIPATVQLGQLYAVKGDLEYFVKTGDMEAALANYRLAETYGHSPPEIQYRMGSAYYQLENWRSALEYLFNASSQLPLNRRILYAMGNAAYRRGDYFAAQGYYNRLLDLLESQRVRLPVLLPNDSPQFIELGERLMMARNNAAVVYEALAEQTGNRDYRSTALALYAESARAWDAITRDPASMIRMRLAENPGAPGINLGYLNANNALRPASDYKPEIFPRIDRDVIEPSRWEELAPSGGMIN